MSASFLDRVDWSRPWLAPLFPAAIPVLRAPDWREALNGAAQGILNHQALPIRFVPQVALPSDTAYEAYISATGNVPTRNNLHDFFNAVIWLTFPKIKAQLNALQATEIARVANVQCKALSISSGRGRLRDAATIFDENAAILIARDSSLINDLREHRWTDLFISRRAAFGSEIEVWLFGHALIEKLVSPYKAITAHSWVVEAGDEFFKMALAEKRLWIDSMVTAQLKRSSLLTSDFAPLPVLGIPGWSEGQDEHFYMDAAVFRPKRSVIR